MKFLISSGESTIVPVFLAFLLCIVIVIIISLSTFKTFKTLFYRSRTVPQALAASISFEEIFDTTH